ncbi:hypothetical protein [Arthrobacter alpinus]|uniref:hypothetical protein n=1 Tax=Arthrobacter alpinus TaxID=656366 RepID=UPI00164826C0|nr:hypothetical protein [Arthrobacter alpinus]
MKTDKGAAGIPPAPPKRRLILWGSMLAGVLILSGGIWAVAGGKGVQTASSQSSVAVWATTAPSSGPSTSAIPDPNKDTGAKTTATPPVPTPAAGTPKSDADLAATPPTVLSPKPFGVVSVVEGKFSAKVSDLTAITGEAKGPGEIAGPAVRFVVTFDNGSSEPMSLGNVVINVDSGADKIPAIPLSGSDTSVFPETVNPGQSATATYVFLMPESQRDQVRVFLTYSASSPIAVFEGSAPKVVS